MIDQNTLKLISFNPLLSKTHLTRIGKPLIWNKKDNKFYLLWHFDRI